MTIQEYFQLCDDCYIEATDLIGSYYYWLLSTKKYSLAKELKEVQCHNLALDIAIKNLDEWSNELNKELLTYAGILKHINK